MWNFYPKMVIIIPAWFPLDSLNLMLSKFYYPSCSVCLPLLCLLICFALFCHRLVWARLLHQGLINIDRKPKNCQGNMLGKLFFSSLMENMLMSPYSLLLGLQMDQKALRKEFGDKNIKPLRKSSFSTMDSESLCSS